jgi:indole-3-glycerol phosphate synthase
VIQRGTEAPAWRPPRGVLAELVATAREDCARRMRERPRLLAEVASRPRRTPRFEAALGDGQGFPIICEVKRSSPSAGTIRAVDAASQARAYVAGGARCVSVLTEERRFGGGLGDLRAVRQAVPVPLLRKDFIVDAHMLAEAVDEGADAVLLLAGALEPATLRELWVAAADLGLDVLLEVVQPHELEGLRSLGATLVGINARDLETLEVDAARFERLAPLLARPGRLLVAESGIRTPDDVRRLVGAGAGAALVGESVMRAGDPVAAVRALVEATCTPG